MFDDYVKINKKYSEISNLNLSEENQIFLTIDYNGVPFEF